MFKVNRKVEYALMALKYMSRKRPGELTSAKEVSDAFQGPFEVVARVMQTLAQKGYVRAEMGANGGYQITKDLAKVSFYDLCESILGPVQMVKCLGAESEGCELQRQCNIVTPISLMQKKLVDLYKSVTLLELVQAPEAQKESKSTSRSQVGVSHAARI